MNSSQSQPCPELRHELRPESRPANPLPAIPIRGNPMPTALGWCLRIVVWLQCLGISGRYLFSPNQTESDVYGMLFFDWDWNEPLAQRIDDLGTLACLAAGWVVLISGFWWERFSQAGPTSSAPLGDPPGEPTRWSRIIGILEIAAGLTIAVWCFAMATTHFIRGGLYSELSWGEYAVRYTAPLALVLIRLGKPNFAVYLLRIAAAAVFLVHGYKAWQGYGPFTDLILLTDAKLFQFEWEQPFVEGLLVVIGIVDIVAAVLLIGTRWRSVAIYMAFWGIITAASRITALGFPAWPETLIRAANGGVPLVLALLLLKRREPPVKSNTPVSSNTPVKPLLALPLLLWMTASTAMADAPLQGTQPAQWRLMWTDDPCTSATLSWSTAAKGRSHTARYHVRGQQGTEATVLAESGRYTGGSTELHYHHARLTDLQPSTAYEVQMVSDDESSPVFYFITAPNDDRPFHILHGGDSRSDQKARRGVNQMIASLVDQSYANEDADDDIIALAHGGDYIVSGKKMDLWSMWMSDHELTTGADGRLLPIIPARGNHDSGKPFDQVFGFPEGDLNYYAISIGKSLRFVTLNSEISTAGAQAKWLNAELAASRPTHDWLLAQYHRPVYPAVKTPGSALQSWVPLFEKHNVDLVCEADGHNIKRTVPIRNNKIDETGVVYIGEGGLGVPQRTPHTDRWFLQSPGMADKGDHVFRLSFNRDELIGQCVMVDGTIRDEFTRPRRK